MGQLHAVARDGPIGPASNELVNARRGPPAFTHYTRVRAGDGRPEAGISGIGCMPDKHG